MNDGTITTADKVVFTMIGAIAVLAACYVTFGKDAVLHVLLSEVTAAWVQAVGSIGAIAAAIWIGQQSERSASRGARDHAIAFKVSLIDGLGMAIGAADAGDIYGFRMAKAVLADVMHLGQGVRIDLMTDPATIINTTRIRTLAAAANMAIEVAERRDLSEIELRFAAGELRNVRAKFYEIEGITLAQN